MNNLSWFLYAAEVIPAFGAVMSDLSLTLCVITIAVMFVFTMAAGQADEFSDPLYKKIMKRAFITIIVSSFLLVMTSLIPSKQTIYLMAGSEAGETVVTSQTGQEILNDVKEVIRTQLNELKAEKK